MCLADDAFGTGGERCPAVDWQDVESDDEDVMWDISTAFIDGARRAAVGCADSCCDGDTSESDALSRILVPPCPTLVAGASLASSMVCDVAFHMAPTALPAAPGFDSMAFDETWHTMEQEFDSPQFSRVASRFTQAALDPAMVRMEKFEELLERKTRGQDDEEEFQARRTRPGQRGVSDKRRNPSSPSKQMRMMPGMGMGDTMTMRSPKKRMAPGIGMGGMGLELASPASAASEKQRRTSPGFRARAPSSLRVQIAESDFDSSCPNSPCFTPFALERHASPTHAQQEPGQAEEQCPPSPTDSLPERTRASAARLSPGAGLRVQLGDGIDDDSPPASPCHTSRSQCDDASPVAQPAPSSFMVEAPVIATGVPFLAGGGRSSSSALFSSALGAAPMSPSRIGGRLRSLPPVRPPSAMISSRSRQGHSVINVVGGMKHALTFEVRDKSTLGRQLDFDPKEGRDWHRPPASSAAMFLDLSREAPFGSSGPPSVAYTATVAASASTPFGKTCSTRLSKSSSVGALHGYGAPQPFKEKQLPKLSSKKSTAGNVAWSMRMTQVAVGRDRLANMF